MAVTQEQSVQVARGFTKPSTLNAPHEWHGRLRIAYFNFTQGAAAGDAGSLAELVKLPAGKCRVILSLSRIAFSAMGTSRTMDLGWLGFTNDSGVAVPADPNGLDDGVAVNAAGSVVPGGTVGGDETFLFESRSEVTLTAQINDGTLPAAGTLNGYFVYIVD